MNKVVLNAHQKQSSKLRKTALNIKQTIETKANGNVKKNKNPKNISEFDVNETILRWDNLISKSDIFNRNRQNSETGDASMTVKIAQKLRKDIEDEKKSKKYLENDMKSMLARINNLKAETMKKPLYINNEINNKNAPNCSADRSGKSVLKTNSTSSNTSCELESLKAEMGEMNEKLEQLNEKLKIVTSELSNEKSNNVSMMSSYTAILDKHKNLELELKTKTLEGACYEDKLEKTAKELETVRAEKDDLQNRLLESEKALCNANERIDSLTDEYEYSVADFNNKLKEVDEEREGWNDFQIKMEQQITEDQSALARKEQYIKQQDITVDELTQEKKIMKEQLKEMMESKSFLSAELEKYKNLLGNLTAAIADMKKTFAVTEASYNKEMSEINNKLEEQDNLIAVKAELIRQQQMMLNLMREINPETDEVSRLKYKLVVEEKEKQKLFDELEKVKSELRCLGYGSHE